jgi:hypothetical protein
VKLFPVCFQLGNEATSTVPERETTPAPILIDPEAAQQIMLKEALPLTSVMSSSQQFEGDILGIDTEIDPSNLKELAKNFVKDESKRWPGGVVAFQLSTFFRPLDRSNIRAAMDVIQAKTCVKFRPKTDETDYVYIAPGFGCSSFVGKQGNQQVSVLQVAGCMKPGIIQHDLMHSLGFYHEQSRTDRDTYVDINWENIAYDNKKQFQSYSDAEVTDFGEPYDFGSVMHYGMNDFAVNPDQYTIRPKAEFASFTIGQRDGISEIDVKKINLAYCTSANGACPSTAGWMGTNEKCYFFSFLAGQQPTTFVQARKFCRNQNSRIGSTTPTAEGLSFLLSTISSSSEALSSGGVWLNNCEVLSAQTSDINEDQDCDTPLHFVCEKVISH